MSGVPTGIVYVGGEEVGRLTTVGAWKVPEAALVKLLNGGPALQ